MGKAVRQESVVGRSLRHVAEHRAVGVLPKVAAVGMDEVQGGALGCLIAAFPAVGCQQLLYIKSDYNLTIPYSTQLCIDERRVKHSRGTMPELHRLKLCLTDYKDIEALSLACSCMACLEPQCGHTAHQREAPLELQVAAAFRDSAMWCRLHITMCPVALTLHVA